MAKRRGTPAGGGSDPLVSACLIVRDEEEMLPDCLASLRGVADEVVVVDTGSADATPEIARRAGARVCHLPWRDDFAAARNAALERAHGRWILQIDADERLVAPGGGRVDAPSLRRLLAAPPAGLLRHDLVKLPLRCALEGGVWEVTAAPRLFRRRPGLRYTYRIHETLFDSRTPHTACLLNGAELVHLGYRADVQARRRKSERNLRLCRLALEEHPDDPVPRFYYGFELARAGRTEEAIPHLRQAWDRMPPWMVGGGIWWAAVIRAGELMNMAGLAAEALERVTPLLARFPHVAHLHFLRGEALRKLGRPREALDCLRGGLTVPPAPVDWEPANTRPYLWNAIGLVHEQLREPAEAVRAYRASLALGPTPCAEARLAALRPEPAARALPPV